MNDYKSGFSDGSAGSPGGEGRIIIEKYFGEEDKIPKTRMMDYKKLKKETLIDVMEVYRRENIESRNKLNESRKYNEEIAQKLVNAQHQVRVLKSCLASTLNGCAEVTTLIK